MPRPKERINRKKIGHNSLIEGPDIFPRNPNVNEDISQRLKGLAPTFKKVNSLLGYLLNDEKINKEELVKFSYLFSALNKLYSLKKNEFAKYERFKLLEVFNNLTLKDFKEFLKNKDYFEKDDYANANIFLHSLRLKELDKNLKTVFGKTLNDLYSIHKPLNLDLSGIFKATEHVLFSLKQLPLKFQYSLLRKLFPDFNYVKKGYNINFLLRFLLKAIYRPKTLNDRKYYDLNKYVKDNYGNLLNFILSVYSESNILLRKTTQLRKISKKKSVLHFKKINENFSVFNTAYEYFFISTRKIQKNLFNFFRKRFKFSSDAKFSLKYFDIPKYKEVSNNMNKMPDFILVVKDKGIDHLYPIDFKITFNFKPLYRRFQISKANLKLAFINTPKIRNRLGLGKNIKFHDGFFLGFSEFNRDKDFFTQNKNVIIDFGEIYPEMKGKLYSLFEKITDTKPQHDLQINAFLYSLYLIMDKQGIITTSKKKKFQKEQDKMRIFAQEIANYVLYGKFSSERNTDDLIPLLRKLYKTNVSHI